MLSKPISGPRLLEVENVFVRYGKAPALEKISFDIPEGIIAAFVGANGAGKTTLLRVISGLKKPESGLIRYRGKRIDVLRAYQIIRHGVAHVPEGGEIFRKITVRENLDMGSYTQKDRKKVAGALERVYHHFPVLKERGSQMAGTLSGGEQQMLAISRALMSSPQLLLSDEPSLGLSPVMIQEIGRIIQDINHEGTSILLVEQNIQLALKLSQKAYVLDAGRLVVGGETRSLMDNEDVKKAYLGV
jgi:branched-chain amino acid transport system ATP-binding protein